MKGRRPDYLRPRCHIVDSAVLAEFGRYSVRHRHACLRDPRERSDVASWCLNDADGWRDERDCRSPGAVRDVRHVAEGGLPTG